jgi:hypothetical protein
MLEGQYFDAVGYHTRSPYALQTFGKAWLADSNLTTGHKSFPKKLIVPSNSNLWPVSNNDSQQIFTDWIDKLADHLGATIEKTSISEFWNSTANKPGTDFASYMQWVGFDLIWKNQIAKVFNPFKKAYAAIHDGRTPFINPFPAARIEVANRTTDELEAVAYDRWQFFKKWFGEEVVKPDSESCSESLFLIPMAAGELVSKFLFN